MTSMTLATRVISCDFLGGVARPHLPRQPARYRTEAHGDELARKSHGKPRFVIETGAVETLDVSEILLRNAFEEGPLVVRPAAVFGIVEPGHGEHHFLAKAGIQLASDPHSVKGGGLARDGATAWTNPSGAIVRLRNSPEAPSSFSSQRGGACCLLSSGLEPAIAMRSYCSRTNPLEAPSSRMTFSGSTS